MEKTGTKENKIKSIGLSFVVSFLLMFMIFIFGPAEIFFANSAEFKFVYGEFAGRMALIGVIASIVVTLLVSFLPKLIRNIFLSILFGISIAGYIQVMFINKNLDLLGLNPEGYAVATRYAVKNMFVWIVIIALVIVLSLWKNDIWKQVVSYGSVFLICIQAVALVSLVVTAEDNAWHYEDDGAWYLSGENQYTVSGDKNIIVIVLDYFSNTYLDPVLEEYPDAIDFLHDFTYYSNADCAYFGTYPSLAHFLSGWEPEPQLKINDWLAKIWQEEYTQGFYQALRDQNYVSNLYTPDKNMVCGMNGVEVMDGTFSNLDNAGQDLVVDYKLLTTTMTKISAYRFLPYILKPSVYVQLDEYANVVTPRVNQITHYNYVFYENLLENGLTVDNESNYYIVQHLMGAHVYTTGADGHYKENATREETARGCLVAVEEYINQLKELGVYDDATIIVTSDHGAPRESQVIFFMKTVGESHDELMTSHAPISLWDYMATIAQAAGIDHEEYGYSVLDIPEDEPRERIAWVRLLVDSLPYVPKYSGEGEGASNAYCGFYYTGDLDDLIEKYDAGPDVVIPETDAFF